MDVRTERHADETAGMRINPRACRPSGGHAGQTAGMQVKRPACRSNGGGADQTAGMQTELRACRSSAAHAGGSPGMPTRRLACRSDGRHAEQTAGRRMKRLACSPNRWRADGTAGVQGERKICKRNERHAGRFEPSRSGSACTPAVRSARPAFSRRARGVIHPFSGSLRMPGVRFLSFFVRSACPACGRPAWRSCWCFSRSISTSLAQPACGPFERRVERSRPHKLRSVGMPANATTVFGVADAILLRDEAESQTARHEARPRSTLPSRDRKRGAHPRILLGIWRRVGIRVSRSDLRVSLRLRSQQ
jgi:hypothetical protein